MTTTVAAAFVSPTTSVYMSRQRSALFIAQCLPQADVGAPTAMDHPLTWYLNDKSADILERHASVSASSGFLVVASLAVAIVVRHRLQLHRAAAVLMLLHAVLVQYLAPAIVFSSVLALGHSESRGVKFIGALAFAALVAAAAWSAFQIVVRFNALVSVSAHNGKQQYSDAVKGSHWGSFLAPFYDAASDSARTITRIYFFEELLTSCVFSAAALIAMSSCRSGVWTLVVTTGLHIVYLLALRPRKSKIEFAFAVLIGCVAQPLIVAFTVLVSRETQSGADPSAGYVAALEFLSTVCAAIFFVQAAVLGGWALYRAHVRKRNLLPHTPVQLEVPLIVCNSSFEEPPPSPTVMTTSACYNPLAEYRPPAI